MAIVFCEEIADLFHSSLQHTLEEISDLLHCSLIRSYLILVAAKITRGLLSWRHIVVHVVSEGVLISTVVERTLKSRRLI